MQIDSVTSQQDPADINYSLVIVGYNDTDVANSYWIARAAFGQDFGLDGHVHIVCCAVASVSDGDRLLLHHVYLLKTTLRPLYASLYRQRVITCAA